MSEFVAGAFVDVKADTKGFREDLRRKVNASINSMGTFKIPVELDPKRFKSTVNAAAKSSPAKIPIVPQERLEQPLVQPPERGKPLRPRQRRRGQPRS